MDCKTTSWNKFTGGFTLVEMMVGIGIGSIMFAVLASLTLYSARSFSSLANYADLNKETRMALDLMSKEIRQSRGLIERKSDATYIAFKIDGGTLSYTYDKNAKTVTEEKSGEKKVVLKNCTFWTNQIFQRQPQSGSLDFIETTEISECKVVQLGWNCAAYGTQRTTNSENAESMMVVIRKKPD